VKKERFWRTVPEHLGGSSKLINMGIIEQYFLKIIVNKCVKLK